MKLTMYTELKVYRKKEPTPYKLDNGSEGTSYTVCVDDGGEVFDCKISEDAYNAVENGEVYVFSVAYSDAYGRKDIRIAKTVKHVVDETLLGSCIVQAVKQLSTSPFSEPVRVDEVSKQDAESKKKK